MISIEAKHKQPLMYGAPAAAIKDWRECPACLGTGASYICTAKGDGKCTVCQGSGWMHALDDIEDAYSELLATLGALDDTIWPPEPARSGRSLRGSLPLLRAHPGPGDKVRDELERSLDDVDAEMQERHHRAKTNATIIRLAREDEDEAQAV